MAQDANGNYVVIELKAGIAEEKAISQTLRYISWIRKNLAKSKGVRGIIVASDFSSNFKHAIEEVEQIKAVRYRVDFEYTEL